MSKGNSNEKQPVNKVKRYLGFDFGLKRIGVAVGQTQSCTAQALLILPARNGQPDWQQVATLISEWQPQGLVVGIPYRMSGEEAELTARARRFKDRLHGRFGLPVFEQDERLSSIEAQWRIDESATGSKKSGLDAVAAQVILEDWLLSRG